LKGTNIQIIRECLWKQRDHISPILLACEVIVKNVVFETGCWPSPDTKTASTFIFDFSTSKNYEKSLNKFLLSLSYLIYGIFSQQPEWVKTSLIFQRSFFMGRTVYHSQFLTLPRLYRIGWWYFFCLCILLLVPCDLSLVLSSFFHCALLKQQLTKFQELPYSSLFFVPKAINYQGKISILLETAVL
jgi:hypothetical protein